MQHNVDAYTVNLPAMLAFYCFAKKREKKNDMSFQFNYLFFYDFKSKPFFFCSGFIEVTKRLNRYTRLKKETC